MKLLIGGSPCTHWSIAQTKNRETTAEGVGWELFKNYVIARNKFQPDYFLYENNKSMSPAIRTQITEELGVEPVLINSAKVSAQNRQRLYWVGKRNEDGSYSQVDIEQPDDKGILLRDIIESESGIGWIDKSYCLTTRCCAAIPEDTLKRHKHTMIAEPVCVEFTENREAEPIVTTPEGKSFCVSATEAKGSNPQHTLTKHTRTMIAEPVRVGAYNGGSQGCRIYSVDTKSVTLCGNAGGGGAKTGLYAMPVRVGEVNGGGQGNRIYSADGKAITQSASSGGLGGKTGLYAIPVDVESPAMVDIENQQFVSGDSTEAGDIHFLGGFAKQNGKLWCNDGKVYSRNFNQGKRLHAVDGKSTCVAEPVDVLCGASRGRYIGEGGSVAQHFEVRDDGKTNTLTTVSKDNCAVVRLDCSAGRMVGRRVNESGHRDDYNEDIERVQRVEINDNPDKTNCLTTVQKDNMVVIGIPNEDNNIQVECGKKQLTIYRVEDGIITIKGKSYPIKLKDGFYIIRKLTVTECMRLQTVPEWYFTPQVFRVDAVYMTCKNIPNRVLRLPYDVKVKDKVMHLSFDIADIQEWEVEDGVLDSIRSVASRTILDISQKMWDTALTKEADGALMNMLAYHLEGMTGKHVADNKLNSARYDVDVPTRVHIELHKYDMKIVSDSATYKMLGNGWTVDVIVHLMSHFEGIQTEPIDVLSMYDGMACGRIALDKLGADVRHYCATEIEDAPMRVAEHNYPEIAELGDAFQVREDDWNYEACASLFAALADGTYFAEDAVGEPSELIQDA